MLSLSRRAFGLGAAVSAFAAPALAKPKFKTFNKPGALLSEGPVYSTRDNALYWVNITEKEFHRHCFKDGSHKMWTLPQMPGWVIERAKGGFICGLVDGIYLLDLEPLKLELVAKPESHRNDTRWNDAKVDAKGRIYTGTMHMPFAEKVCGFYRIDTDLSVHKVDDGYLCTNGPTFSLDGTKLYHAESGPDRRVYQYDVADNGDLSNKRLFVQYEGDMGGPDGMTTDADGGIWLSHYNGGRVSRYLENGQLDFAIPIPARQITSVAFGGKNWDRMFVTSCAQFTTLEADPQAGCVFEVPKSLIKGHKGVPTRQFGG